MNPEEAQQTLEAYLTDPWVAPKGKLADAVKIALIILIAFNNTLKEVSQ